MIFSRKLICITYSLSIMCYYCHGDGCPVLNRTQVQEPRAETVDDLIVYYG